MRNELSPAYSNISTWDQLKALHRRSVQDLSPETQNYVERFGYGYRDIVCCNKPCEMNLHACEKADSKVIYNSISNCFDKCNGQNKRCQTRGNYEYKDTGLSLKEIQWYCDNDD